MVLRGPPMHFTAGGIGTKQPAARSTTRSALHGGRAVIKVGASFGNKSLAHSRRLLTIPLQQCAADPRFVIEGSVQIPVIRNTGPLILLTDVNVLLGVKYLF